MIAYFDKMIPGSVNHVVNKLIEKHRIFVLENQSLVERYSNLNETIKIRSFDQESLEARKEWLKEANDYSMFKEDIIIY